MFSHQIPNCRRTQNAKTESVSKVVKVEGEQGFTLISFIDTVSVETRGTVSPVKWQRTMSSVGRLGREMATRRERMKAQKRRMTLGRKKARAAMTMVSDQEPWTSCWSGAQFIPFDTLPA
jgi:hypothetical protein